MILMRSKNWLTRRTIAQQPRGRIPPRRRPIRPRRSRPPRNSQRDAPRNRPLRVKHRLPQRLHGVAVRLMQQRDAVHVQQLVVGPQALVARRRPAVYDTLDEDAQVLRTAGLSFDADAQTGLFGIVHRDVQGEDLAVLPREYETVFRLIKWLLKLFTHS